MIAFIETAANTGTYKAKGTAGPMEIVQPKAGDAPPKNCCHSCGIEDEIPCRHDVLGRSTR